MTVLTLTGKKINWAKPPHPTARVMWSQRDTSGRAVTGSLRTIAHLDHLNTLAVKKFDSGIVVMQPPYNTTVPQSEGTHDFDACLDVFIPNVSWETQQRFFRANGAGAYYREPPAFTSHIHYFTLPPREGSDVSDDYRSGGFKVGRYVDGGWSTYGRRVASSQIEDYYNHRTALSGHAHDPSWFPPDIGATIFNLNAYVNRQRVRTRLSVALINIPNKIGTSNVRRCWDKAAARSAIFGVNESFHKTQRQIYSQAMADSKAKWSQYGLWQTPNPVFWRSDRFKRINAEVHLIHPANTTAPNHAKWPGFYDARFITEVVLKQRVGGQEVAILNTHLVYGAKVLDQKWLRTVRRTSKSALRRLVRKHRDAGRIAIVMGDMNTKSNFAMPRGFRWFTKRIIDKVGANREGSATLFVAPTDHKHGVRATIRL